MNIKRYEARMKGLSREWDIQAVRFKRLYTTPSGQLTTNVLILDASYSGEEPGFFARKFRYFRQRFIQQKLNSFLLLARSEARTLSPRPKQVMINVIR